MTVILDENLPPALAKALLDRGRIVAAGTPEETLTEALLGEVFAVMARVAASPHHGRPHITFLPFPAL